MSKKILTASALLEESANNGFLDAMFHLAQVFMMNDVYDKAMYWLEKADMLGHPEAKTHMEYAKLLSGALRGNSELKDAFDRQNKEYWGS